MPEYLGYQFDRVYGQPIEKYRQVATIAERDAIPSGKRWEGMLCYVTSESTDYQLKGGVTNTDWANAATGINEGTQTYVGKIKIGDYWVDKGTNTDNANLEVGDKFDGYIESNTRYVAGIVTALPFDVDDNTKVSLVINNYL